MTLTLPRSAAGFALLAVLAAGCGTAVSGHHGAAAPATTQHAPAHPAMHAPAHAKAHSAPADPIPQGNGGDHDPDNNGGPSDGDGNI
jgi:hypothetical protein